MHLCPFIMLRMITVCKFYDIRRLSEEFIIEIMQIEFWIVIARWCEIERKISLKESSFDVAIGEIFFSYFFFILLIKLKSEKWNQAETPLNLRNQWLVYIYDFVLRTFFLETWHRLFMVNFEKSLALVLKWIPGVLRMRSPLKLVFSSVSKHENEAAGGPSERWWLRVNECVSASCRRTDPKAVRGPCTWLPNIYLPPNRKCRNSMGIDRSSSTLHACSLHNGRTRDVVR